MKNTDLVNKLLIITAVVFGAFAVFVTFQLISNNISTNKADPLDVELISDLRLQLQKTPDSTHLKDQIRELDLLVRRTYFTSITFQKTGAILLLASLLLTVIALRALSGLNTSLPNPGKHASKDDSLETAQLSRNAMLASLAVILISSVVISLQDDSTLPAPKSLDPFDPSPAPEQAIATQNIHTNTSAWPCLRGANGHGIAFMKDAPTNWDGATGSNIIWKTPIPRLGFNSPIVVDGRVYLSCADEEAREVVCFDAESGEILWQNTVGPVPGSPADLPDVMEDVSFAASTMATDGIHVFSIYATGNIVCFDLDGNKKWSKYVGPFENDFGYGSSLITYKDTLILQLDNQNQSKIMALKAKDGKIVWETTRDVIVSWSTPIIIDTPTGAQLAVNGNPKVKGYDPETGKELWSHECMDGEVAPSPAYANGTVFFTTEYQNLFAIKPASPPEVIWAADGDLPDVSSPLATDKYVFLASSSAVLSCYDVTTGELLWSHDTDEGFYSSPVLVGDTVYVTDKEGMTIVLEEAAELKIIAQPKLGETVSCTPAFINGRIYMRGEKHLYCIGIK